VDGGSVFWPECHERLTAFVGTLLAVSASGQTIKAFNDSTSIWYVADTYPNGNINNPSFIETSTLEYSIGSDTLIIGNSWHELLFLDHRDSTTSVLGHVRQDGDHGLFRSVGNSIDTLYDYAAQVGDSVVSTGGGYYPTLHVVKVDTVQLMGVFHRRIAFDTIWVTLESYYTDIWIEGIGSIHGPVARLVPSMLETDRLGFQDSTRLACYENSDGSVFSHSGYGACINNDLLTGVGELEGSEAGLLRIYPNPSTSKVLVPMVMGGEYVTVHDMKGIQVHEQVLKPSGVSTVELGSLPAGIYAIHVHGSDGRVLAIARVSRVH
jgi:hypothetical protein